MWSLLLASGTSQTCSISSSAAEGVWSGSIAGGGGWLGSAAGAVVWEDWPMGSRSDGSGGFGGSDGGDSARICDSAVERVSLSVRASKLSSTAEMEGRERRLAVLVGRPAMETTEVISGRGGGEGRRAGCFMVDETASVLALTNGGRGEAEKVLPAIRFKGTSPESAAEVRMEARVGGASGGAKELEAMAMLVAPGATAVVTAERSELVIGCVAMVMSTGDG